MTRAAVMGFVWLAVAPAAWASGPSGFAEFPWGTTADVLRERFLARRCDSYRPFASAFGSSTCYKYRVEGIAVILVRLDFEPDDLLAGYYMVVARHSYPAVRALALERFGPPAWRTAVLWFGEQLFWSWDQTQATLIQQCGEEVSCLEVKTLALARKREVERARQNENPF